MDLASLLFPPRVGAATSLPYPLGGAMLARAARRQAQSRAARCTAELVGERAPLLAPHHGAFSAPVAAAVRCWKGL